MDRRKKMDDTTRDFIDETRGKIEKIIRDTSRELMDKIEKRDQDFYELSKSYAVHCSENETLKGRVSNLEEKPGKERNNIAVWLGVVGAYLAIIIQSVISWMTGRHS